MERSCRETHSSAIRSTVSISAFSGDSAFGRRSVDGIVEVFNVLNHVNYGSYTTQETSASYGLPAQNTDVSYQPRMLQLGFRVSF